jgi:hypothetical protein
MLTSCERKAVTLLETTALGFKEIAEQTNVSVSCVSRLRRKMGLRQLSEEEESQNELRAVNMQLAVEKVRSGYSLKEAARGCNVSYAALCTYCSRNNVRRRSGKLVYIYALRCPLSRQVFYVGRATNPWTRFYQHISKPTSHLTASWIKHLKKQNRVPLLAILDHRTTNDPQGLESEWIHKLADAGHPLLNLQMNL